MSCYRLRLPKKLFPSKKAYKSFVSILNTHLPRSLHKIHHHIRPFFGRNTTNNRSHSRTIRYQRRRHQNANTIYVESAPMMTPDKAVVTRRVETSSSGGKGGGGQKWKEYLESMPPIRGVDERAEEFIMNFRQQMRIQREQSLLDFQEMLARSA